MARGKPSSTVAWLADDPGMPRSTDENVSEVGMTAKLALGPVRVRTPFLMVVAEESKVVCSLPRYW